MSGSQEPEDRVKWEDLDRELVRLGFKYHAFLSFARSNVSRLNVAVARAFYTALVAELAMHLSAPRVFFDEECIGPGDVWPTTLADALTNSVCLAAVCIPVYFSPNKAWCGFEWASMCALSDRRLPSRKYRSIVPMLFRSDPPLPDALTGKEGIQYEDFSAIAMSAPEDVFLTTVEGRTKIIKVVKRMKRFALHLVEEGKPPPPLEAEECEAYPFAAGTVKATRLPVFSGPGGPP